MSSLVSTTCFYTDISSLITYAHSLKYWKPNNLKVFGNKYAKGSKQDSHNQLRLPMPVLIMIT